MQDDKKEKPKDEKKKKNKYIVKDGDGNIMDVDYSSFSFRPLAFLSYHPAYL